MTRDEIMAMDLQQLGLTIQGYFVRPGLPLTMNEYLTGVGHEIWPNWAEDVHAAWRLENDLLTDQDRYKYTVHLNWIINRDLYLADQRFALIHATADQRCRAWLMWKAGV